MPLDLLVPQLLPPRDAPPEMAELRLPALERALAAASLQVSAARGAHEWLGAEFGLGEPAPFAAIARAGESGPPPQAGSAWLRADPVHIRIDRDSVRLHGPAVLGIGFDEAHALVEALQAHFRADGLVFEACAADRWYVRLPADESPATTPLAAVLGRRVHEQLPASRGAINWRTALTEAQMVLGAHDVNARREAARQPAINSVWFWGEGGMPASVARRYDLVGGGDALARGLAALSGAHTGLARDESLGAKALHFFDALALAIERSDLAAWRAAASAFDAEWFADVRSLLARFGEVRVILPREADTLVATLKRPTLFGRLRAAKPIAAYG